MCMKSNEIYDLNDGLTSEASRFDSHGTKGVLFKHSEGS